MKKWHSLMFFLGVLCAALVLSTARKVGHTSVHAVLSGSMGRAVPTGSLVVSRLAERGEYQVGEVIIFPDPENAQYTIAHRVTQRQVLGEGALLQTKGDANPNGDSWDISEATVLGRVVLIIPYLGYVPLYLRTLPGFVIFSILSFALLVLPLLYRRSDISTQRA